MGELYKVRHVHLGEFRVVKLLRADQLADETQRKRFLQEAKIAASIKHPNVGLLHDFASLSDGTYYMVEEFIDGLTISRSIRAGRRFTLGEIVDIGRQVLSGLVAIHDRGIIHRDISPDNIMLTSHDGALQARIIDLGIAKHLGVEGQALTSAGLFLGKPHYASPEQMRMMETTEQIDHRTDLYSVGVVLYEMIVGEVPFEAATPLAYLLKQISEEVKSVSRDVSGVVPSELDAFIVRLLKTKREERFATARDALRALDEVIAAIPQLLYRAELGAAPAEKSFPRVTPKPRREGTDEIPFDQLAQMIEHDRTRPGDGVSLPPELVAPRDDGSMPTAVQSLDDLLTATERIELAGRDADAPGAATLASKEVPLGTTLREKTLPASKPLPGPPPAPRDEVELVELGAPPPMEIPPIAPTASAGAPVARTSSRRGPIVVIGAIAFVIVVAVGGWLFFLLLQRFGAGAETAPPATVTDTPPATDTAAATPSTAQPAVAPTATAVPAPPPAATSTAAAPPPDEPAKPKVVERPSRPRTPPTPPPAATVAPTETAASETATAVTEQPEEPAVREGDIVGPGEGVVDAQVLKLAEPLVPPSSAVMGHRGFAMFSVLVGIDGRVENTKLIRSSGSPAFDELATAAAKRTTFTPATKDGVRVRMWRTIRYDVKTRG